MTAFAILAHCAANCVAVAEEVAAPATGAEIRTAVERGLAILQKGARNYPSNRECFACHHQTLPLLGMKAAARIGLTIDDALLPEIVEFTQVSFRDKLEKLQAGEGIGGKGLTVGYGLWTLKLGAFPPDELTSAMVTYLLKTQLPDGHWELHSIRPPAEESLVMSTVVAASGIRQYATAEQRIEATAALEKARAWLRSAKGEVHEDQVARLWGLGRLGGDTSEQLADATQKLLAKQGPDGGWSPAADLESDAYATGTALFALLEAPQGTSILEVERGPRSENSDVRSPADEAIARGVTWLVRHQLPDGSWHVTTRATPVQLYFDNGDPHGKDQFISISATGWATAALARQLEVVSGSTGQK